MSPIWEPLLAGLIDYAGLFPPAALAMDQATSQYTNYRASNQHGYLARFILPYSRIAEWQTSLGSQPSQPWTISLLATDPAQLAEIPALNQRYQGWFVIDTAEIKAESLEQIAAIHAARPEQTMVFVEIPHDHDPSHLIAALRSTGLRAKLRTGGIIAEAFPEPEQIVRFLHTCISNGVAYKATAGLHHPLRGQYRLTYATDSAEGWMYGYLNLILASALLQENAAHHDVLAALLEHDPTTIKLTEQKMSWRNWQFEHDDVLAVRHNGLIAFGSCSFEEPINEFASFIEQPALAYGATN